MKFYYEHTITISQNLLRFAFITDSVMASCYIDANFAHNNNDNNTDNNTNTTNSLIIIKNIIHTLVSDSVVYKAKSIRRDNESFP